MDYNKFKPENYATTRDNYICKKHKLRVCILKDFAHCPKCYDEDRKTTLELNEIIKAPKKWKLNNHFYLTLDTISEKGVKK